MSTAILTGPPVAGSPLEGDLRALGFDVRTADDPLTAAELIAAVPAQERVAVVDPRFVGHRHTLRLALTDPRFPAAAVPGALTAQPEARAALTHAATKIPVGAGTAHLTDVLTGTLTDALERADVGLQRIELGSLVAAVPLTPAQREDAQEAVAAVDGEAVRLRTAVKSRDGFFTTHCISPYSRYLARWCARRGLTPNQVTTASLLTALIAAGCAATGSRGGFIAAGVLLLFSFVLDCTDGQLARYSLQYSTMGAWLDATFDRAKEYAYYAGLALGAARGGDDVWALALGAMVLQTCRHIVDFSFNEAIHVEGGASANTSPTAALSDKLDSVGWTIWARRMIVLPIGERWAMIAVLTALTTPRIVFYALLIGCALAACYTTAGRVLRSLTRRARRTDRAAQALADLADSGPLAELIAGTMRGRSRAGSFLAPAMAFLSAAVLLVCVIFEDDPASWLTVGVAACAALLSGVAVARPLKGVLDWLVPPFFRVAEYTTILVLAARADVPGALPAAFGLVAAVAYHHYDVVYRIRGGSGAPPRWLVRAAGGSEGRILVVTVLAALLSPSGFTIALTALAVAVALLVLAESIGFWVSSGAPAVHDEGEPA
ncbi:DUF5941 domain-containing protein [Streptomyces pinistramenti]|uniref:DUF5941 domain-containing protein n=1 Tax=Streptomyces pinistramenti TaxID=2884812 RepID=UPI001D06CB55|nr:DUF5941 domain-containing protein [Streptomyces pinistramenti]MCB5906053.1 CDP-alcohol phosphatidyltransferase family protein [Streptomyces pinistramenti]